MILNRLSRVFYILGLWGIVCFVVSPYNYAFPEHGTGGQPGAFLRIGVGARAMGLGRTFTAIANDASAGYWNPAGIGALRRAEVMASYTFLSMERRYNSMAAVFPLHSLGTVGISWIHLNVGGIEGRDIFGRTTESFSNSESAYLISWGFPIHSSIHLGFTAKYITHSLQTFHSSGSGFDAGLLFKVFHFLNIGTTLKNISTRVLWDTPGGTEEQFPLITRFGLAITPRNSRFILGFDYEQIQDQNANLHIGLELSFVAGFGARIGYDNGKFTVGSYLSIPMNGMDIQTDYSFGEDPIYKLLFQKISIVLRFSKPKEPKRPMDFRKLLPDARVIRVAEQYPNYAIINIGSRGGITDGMIFKLYRDEWVEDTKIKKRLLIGTVKVVRVKIDVSAVRVQTIRVGYSIKRGDLLIREKK